MNTPIRILILDRDAVASRALSEQLEGHGYPCAQVQTPDQVIEALERERASASGDGVRFGVLLADQDAAGTGGGLDLLRRLHDERPEIVPIVISGFRKVESAVLAMRYGAADYLLKPLVEKELISAVQRAAQHHLLRKVQFSPEQEPVGGGDAEQDEPAADEIAGSWRPMPLAQAMQEPERRILLAALEANGWNRQETARQLDINRSTLYKKIRQYRLDEPG